MEKLLPVKTKFGCLSGRDCIFLSYLTQSSSENNLTFLCDLNCRLLKTNEENCFVRCRFVFKNVISYFSCETDTYFNLNEHFAECSFAIIEASEWLKSLPVRKDFDKNTYKHYRLYTYDDVFDIIAEDYVLTEEK